MNKLLSDNKGEKLYIHKNSEPFNATEEKAPTGGVSVELYTMSLFTVRAYAK